MGNYMPVLGYVTPNQQKRGLRNQRERFGKLFAAVNECTIEGLAYDRAKYAHYVDASKPFGFIAFTAHEEEDPASFDVLRRMIVMSETCCFAIAVDCIRSLLVELKERDPELLRSFCRAYIDRQIQIFSLKNPSLQGDNLLDNINKRRRMEGLDGIRDALFDSSEYTRKYVVSYAAQFGIKRYPARDAA